MGVVVKPIEMYAYFSANGKTRPERFRFQNDEGEMHVVKDIKIISRDVDRTADNLINRFECEVLMSNEVKRFELRFEKETSRWTIVYNI